MGLMDKLFNVKGQVNAAMSRAAEQHERLNQLDPTDKDAVEAQTRQANAELEAKMPAFIKRNMPAGMSEKVAKMQQDAIDRQAEMYRRMKEGK